MTRPPRKRRAIAYAIALMERRQVGAAIGINDKADMQWSASGDATQEDCVDDSTNTTSFLWCSNRTACYAITPFRGH